MSTSSYNPYGYIIGSTFSMFLHGDISHTFIVAGVSTTEHGQLMLAAVDVGDRSTHTIPWSSGIIFDKASVDQFFSL
jgi:hypothetical protein